jgi:1,4-alpha-glucan branching enzyme
MNGSLILLLHAHLPYVRHPGYDYSLEEHWLFECIRETYVPLLDTLERLADDGISSGLTLSFSPVLMEMLNDDLLRQRFVRYMDNLTELAEQEKKRTARSAFAPAAFLYAAAFRRVRDLYCGRYGRDLLCAFRKLQDAGHVEIITTAATHAFLPAFEKYPRVIRSQIDLGVESYARVFGRRPEGFWLPECGYFKGLDAHLKRAGIRYFFVESHGLVQGRPRPRYSVYRPVLTPEGVFAFGRDFRSARQVWCADRGYPGDHAYRDFYRDIGFDLPLSYTGAFTRMKDVRTFTGLKYYRVTGKTENKLPYDRPAAMQRAAEHAMHFVRERETDFMKLSSFHFRPAVISAFDAELFGHWWHEGIEWLDMALRKTQEPEATFRVTTPSHYLRGAARTGPFDRIEPAASTWGEGGFSELWIGQRNHHLYRHLHTMAGRMETLVSRRSGSAAVKRAVCQAMREMLLAQASDWAFLMEKDRASTYAEGRVRRHMERFHQLYRMVMENRAPEERVRVMEEEDNVFSWLGDPGEFYALESESRLS